MSDQTLPVRMSIDVVAGSTLVATFFSWLPTTVGVIGGIFSIIWFALNIADHATVRAWFERRAERIRTKKLARLRAKQKIIEAQLVAAEHVRGARAAADDLVEHAKAAAAILATKSDLPPV